MATITGYTKERMKAIEDNTVVNGEIVGDDLVLTKYDGSTINAGDVRGPQGLVGPAGPTTPDDNTVSTAKIQDDAVTLAKMAPNSVGNGQILDNAIDSEHYINGSIDGVHIANDAITGSKIADNSINSEHYVDDSIDRVHIAAGAIGSTEIANDVINSQHYAAGSIDAEHIGTAQVTESKLAGNSVTDAKLNSTAWASLTLGGGVSNFGSGRQTAQYRRVANRVYLRGSIKHPTSNGDGDAMATVPSGYRPAADEVFTVAGSGANVGMYVVVEAAGAVRVYGVANNNIAHLSLSGISFDI